MKEEGWQYYIPGYGMLKGGYNLLSNAFNTYYSMYSTIATLDANKIAYWLGGYHAQAAEDLAIMALTSGIQKAVEAFTVEGKAPVTEPVFEAPKIYSNNKGQLTNGTYTLDAKGMEIHQTGSTTSGKSQFLFGVNAEKATLDAAAYADANNLWVGNKAKVPVADGIVGVTGSGQPTNYINVYKTNTGFIHASPATPPK